MGTWCLVSSQQDKNRKMGKGKAIERSRDDLALFECGDLSVDLQKGTWCLVSSQQHKNRKMDKGKAIERSRDDRVQKSLTLLSQVRLLY
jgi:hypothetical protein